nr:MAG TPA: hypothetical protein [Caudoviricetes sp.]
MQDRCRNKRRNWNVYDNTGRKNSGILSQSRKYEEIPGMAEKEA